VVVPAEAQVAESSLAVLARPRVVFPSDDLERSRRRRLDATNGATHDSLIFDGRERWKR